MDVGGVSWPAVRDALDALARALTEPTPAPAEAGEPGAVTHGEATSPLAGESLAERLLGSLPTASDPSNAPALHVDHGAETASLQTFARADQTQPAQVEAHSRPPDASVPVASHPLGQFALPADQLVQATLIGLQVQQPAQPSWLPPMLLHRPPIEEPPEPAHHEVTDVDEAPPVEIEPESQQAQEAEDETTDELLEADDCDEGCEALARVLLAALQSMPASGQPRSRSHPLGAGAEGALHALLDQWQRGRCVVIACPQGLDPEGPAWAFVMRPRRVFNREVEGRLRFSSLVGRRVPARLQWRQLPLGAHWLHNRMAKEHQPPRGRQLVPLAGPAATCDVQLGPVLAERRRPCEVRLRIDAVRRFWSALGDQWSVLVVVCSLPLAGRPVTEVHHAAR